MLRYCQRFTAKGIPLLSSHNARLVVEMRARQAISIGAIRMWPKQDRREEKRQSTTAMPCHFQLRVRTGRQI
jgi:hypothetical protein